MSYKSIDDLDIDRKGPCLVPGHPKEHVLALNPCWSTLRRYLFDHSFKEYLEAVKRKG